MSAMSLEERIEMPSIPKDVARQIARVEEEFTRAEVEERTYTAFCVSQTDIVALV